MFHSLMMVLAPEAEPVQATLDSPPAVARSAGPSPARGVITLRLVAAVIGNAFGFVALMTGGWMVLQLLQAFL